MVLMADSFPPRVHGTWLLFDFSFARMASSGLVFSGLGFGLQCRYVASWYWTT